MNLLEKARQEHIRLLKIIEEKDRLIVKLQNMPNLVKDAVDMFCHPSSLGDARRWMEENYIQ